MILVEECRLLLDEPVDRVLPELAGRKAASPFFPASRISAAGASASR
jgi:hypothetical protein